MVLMNILISVIRVTTFAQFTVDGFVVIPPGTCAFWQGCLPSISAASDMRLSPDLESLHIVADQDVCVTSMVQQWYDRTDAIHLSIDAAVPTVT